MFSFLLSKVKLSNACLTSGSGHIMKVPASSTTSTTTARATRPDVPAPIPPRESPTRKKATTFEQNRVPNSPLVLRFNLPSRQSTPLLNYIPKSCASTDLSCKESMPEFPVLPGIHDSCIEASTIDSDSKKVFDERWPDEERVVMVCAPTELNVPEYIGGVFNIIKKKQKNKPGTYFIFNQVHFNKSEKEMVKTLIGANLRHNGDAFH